VKAGIVNKGERTDSGKMATRKGKDTRTGGNIKKSMTILKKENRKIIGPAGLALKLVSKRGYNKRGIQIGGGGGRQGL